MSRQTHQRSLWQVLGLYAAGSWVVLQVVDVLTQNIDLPSWVFTLTLALLVIGLPITAATAYFQGLGRAGERVGETVEAGTTPSATRAGTPRGLFTWGNVLKGGVAALALWGVAVTGWMVLGSRGSVKSEWDLVTGLDEIRRRVGAYDYPGANAIARQLDGVITNDSVREAMWSEVSRTLTLRTDPPGATAYRRDYGDPDAPWEVLGVTPVEVERFPFGLSRVRFELDGHLPRETANFSGLLAQATPFVLDTEETLPAGMARVSGASARIWAPGLEQLDSLALADFFMDVHEVTNRRYKEFVDAGGYRDPACWTHPFVRDGRTLSVDEAMAAFVDRTGRPGPSGWQVGSYPEGEGDHPVGGVSWYEAAAYACFAGKALPTVYHWYLAADPFSSNHVVPLSNYGSGGPAPVGSHQGVTRDGIYDMAGNVREWLAGDPGDMRIAVVGGSWQDPTYMFDTPNVETRAPGFDSETVGFRLVRALPQS